MKTLRLALLVCALVAPAWGSFSYYRSITVDYTKVGSSDQSNFPVLVSMSDTTLKTVGNGGHVQNSSGYDICFYADSGATTPLYWEMESYDPVNGIVLAWIKIPNVSHTVNTTFYVFYGDSSRTSFQSTASSVWSNSFTGVWHLPNGSSLSATDSTSNGNGLTNSGATAGTGKIDGGAILARSSSQYLTIPTLTAPSTTISVSAWVKISTSGNYQGIIYSRSGGYQWGIRLNSSNYADFVLGYPSTGWAEVTGSTSLATGTWHQIYGVFTGSAAYLYVDGVQIATSAASPSLSTLTSWRVGSDPGSSDYWDGAIDEPRISYAARPVDWILTEYNNQNSPGNIGSPSFLIFGSETSGSNAYLKSVSDVLVISVISAGIGTHYGNPSDALRPSDSSSGTSGRFAAPADRLILSDYGGARSGRVRATSDSDQAYELAYGHGAHFGSTSDVIPARDAAFGRGSHFVSSLDVLVLLDVAAKSNSKFAAVSEIMLLLEAASGRATHFGGGVEFVVLRESPSGIGGHFGSASDRITSLDVSAGRGAHLAAVLDSLQADDSPIGYGAHSAAVLDRLQVVDSALNRGFHVASPVELMSIVDISGGVKVPLIRHYVAGAFEGLALIDAGSGRVVGVVILPSNQFVLFPLARTMTMSPINASFVLVNFLRTFGVYQ